MTVRVMKDKRKNLIILTIILLALLFVISPHLQTTYMTHQTFMTRITNSTTETTSATTTLPSETEMKSIKSITYINRGGVKGAYNILEISKPNEAIYRYILSPRFGNRSFTLSTNEHKMDSLFRKIVNEYKILDYNSKIYKARHIYDYFTYEIFLELEYDETVRVKWFDE